MLKEFTPISVIRPCMRLTAGPTKRCKHLQLGVCFLNVRDLILLTVLLEGSKFSIHILRREGAVTIFNIF